MKRFSIIEFGSEVNLACGIADKYVLQEYQPLLDMLAALETSEEVLVKITVCWVADDATTDRDLEPEELDDLLARFVEFKEADAIVVDSKYYYRLHGVLTEPFEDYYRLEGKEREEYLALKKEWETSRELMKQALKDDGLSDEEIEQIILRGVTTDDADA